MYRRQGRFPWLPIVIVVIAFLAIFGRGRGEFRQRAVEFEAPRAPQVERYDEREFDRELERRSERYQYYAERHGRGPWERGWHGPFFFAPFFFFGKLLKLLLAIGLIGAGLYLLRRNRRPRWREPGGPDDGPGTPIGPVFRA